MRIIFVRHGAPNYKDDCLTPLGHEQAKKVAPRLEKENISEMYASPFGRAQETASYTSKLLNLPITTLPYMHEISWGGEDIPFDAHPWVLSDRMIDIDGFDFSKEDWTKHPYFKTNTVMDCYHEICTSFDAFLKEKGFIHEGKRFLCTKGNDDTIALFSHGGSGACAISHIMGLPFPFVASQFPFDFTSVTIIEIPGNENEYVHPRIMLMNDMSHTERTFGGPKIQKEKDK